MAPWAGTGYVGAAVGCRCWWEAGESFGSVSLLLQEPHRVQWFPFSGLCTRMAFNSHALIIRPPPGFPLQLGSCGGTSAPELPVLPRLVPISGGSQLKPNFGKGQEKGAGRGKGRSFLGCVRGTPGPFGKCCVCQ